MSPKYQRQNRKVCDVVLIFSQNQRLFFLRVKLQTSPSFKCLWYLLRQDQAVFNFLGRFQGRRRAVFDKLWITPVYASHKATSTRTYKNNIQWWEILPSNDKKNYALKKFNKFRLQPQKKNSIIKKNGVSFTYRRRPGELLCMLRDQTIFAWNQVLCL